MPGGRRCPTLGSDPRSRRFEPCPGSWYCGLTRRPRGSRRHASDSCTVASPGSTPGISTHAGQSKPSFGLTATVSKTVCPSTGRQGSRPCSAVRRRHLRAETLEMLRPRIRAASDWPCAKTMRSSGVVHGLRRTWYLPAFSAEGCHNATFRAASFFRSRPSTSGEYQAQPARHAAARFSTRMLQTPSRLLGRAVRTTPHTSRTMSQKKPAMAGLAVTMLTNGSPLRVNPTEPSPSSNPRR
jgi:hypothetical protein